MKCLPGLLPAIFAIAMLGFGLAPACATAAGEQFIPLPGNEQQAQWLQIRRTDPDFVILWTYGLMSTVGLKTAQRNGFPREKILGAW